jgi:hypothetical protein
VHVRVQHGHFLKLVWLLLSTWKISRQSSYWLRRRNEARPGSRLYPRENGNRKVQVALRRRKDGGVVQRNSLCHPEGPLHTGHRAVGRGRVAICVGAGVSHASKPPSTTVDNVKDSLVSFVTGASRVCRQVARPWKLEWTAKAAHDHVFRVWLEISSPVSKPRQDHPLEF